MRRIVIFMAIALLCSGCAMCRNCRNTALNSTDKMDSLIIKETIVYRDSLIPVLVKDTTAVVHTAPADTARAETDLAKAKAWLESDSLKLTITNKPSPIPPIKVSIPEKAKTEIRTQTLKEVKTVEVNRLTNWQKGMISLGYVFIGICGAAIIFILVKLLK